MHQNSNYHDNNYVSKFLEEAVEFYVNKIQLNKEKILKYRNLIVRKANHQIEVEKELENYFCDDFEGIPIHKIYLKAIYVKIEGQQEQMQMHKKYLDHFTEIQKLRSCECVEES